MSSANPHDPLELMRKMWGSMGVPLPGMVTPTLDVGELDQRIADLKAVEGWLRMNLNMLQLSIQGLEMQRTTLQSMQHMGQAFSEHLKQAQMTATESAATFKSATTDQVGEGANAAASDAEGGAAQAASDMAQAMMWPWTMMQAAVQEQAAAASGVATAATSQKAPSKARRKKTTGEDGA